MSRKLLPLLALVLALGVAACGSSGKHKKQSAESKKQQVERTKQLRIQAQDVSLQKETTKNLAARPNGQFVLDGFSEGSLSQQAYADYQHQGGNEVLSIENDPSTTAFNDFCTGAVDIVDSSSSISKKELAECQNDGITPVQIQVGSDAVVLATENETDVGADCLTDAQVREIFKAGSPIENWDQLGFDDVALKVAGPNPANPDFAFFGSALVNAASPTLQDFRFDYNSYTDEDRIKSFVIGSLNNGELASAKVPAAEGAITSINAYIKGQEDIVVGAKAAEKDGVQTKNAKVVAAAKVNLAKANAQLKTLNAELAAEQTVLNGYKATERASEAVLGHLGVFQYGYYTLYEEQLRPLEITSKTNPENCVFPSQDTITSGDYPLSRQLLLTVSLHSLRTNAGLRQFLLSYLKNANTLTTNDVLVPLPNNVLVQEEDYLEGKKLPTAVTGSVPAAEGENSMSGVSGAGEVNVGTTTTSSGNTGNTGSGNGSQPTGVISGVH